MEFKKTTALVLALPKGKSDHFEWDDSLPGFGVRLRGKNRRWVIQYRVGRQQRRESLGDVRKIDLEAARKIARRRFAEVELGVDPAAERQKAKAEAAAVVVLTVGDVADSYLKRKEGTLRSTTYAQAKLHFQTHWKALRPREINSINRAEVAATLAEITTERGRTAAARARANLSSLFTWAMKEGLCDANPVLTTNDPAVGVDARDRVLGDLEIRSIWMACGDDDFGRIVRLLLLTACRREEIGGLKWGEFDPDTGLMNIPGDRTKNHRSLVLTLPAQAIEMLKAAPRRTGREFVFGGRGGAFSAWSYSKMRMDVALGKTVAPWRLHDLRRTAATGMAELGVQPHIIEAILNHTSGHKAGVAGIYNRASYAREIKAALALWADHVDSIVEGRDHKVLPFKDGV